MRLFIWPDKYVHRIKTAVNNVDVSQIYHLLLLILIFFCQSHLSLKCKEKLSNDFGNYINFKIYIYVICLCFKHRTSWLRCMRLTITSNCIALVLILRTTSFVWYKLSPISFDFIHCIHANLQATGIEDLFHVHTILLNLSTA